MLTKKISYLVLLFACLFAGSLGCAEKKVSNPKAPDFTLTDLKGKKFTLAEQKGNVVLLDFWATWCGPCVMAAPTIEEITKTYTGKAVRIISLSLDQEESYVRQFVKEHKVINRVAMIKDSGVDEQYGVNGIPDFILIDKKGFAVGRWVGFAPELKEIWKKEIDRLLAQ